MTGRIDPRRQTTVYRLFDAQGQLLYIGTTADPQERWAQHGRERLWWSSVVRATVEWYDTRTEALAVEREAIRSECPLHNDKATEREAVFPHAQMHGTTPETLLRRAATEHRKALDKLAITVDRAARSGLTASAIGRSLGIDAEAVMALGRRLEEGGGISHLIADQSAA